MSWGSGSADREVGLAVGAVPCSGLCWAKCSSKVLKSAKHRGMEIVFAPRNGHLPCGNGLERDPRRRRPVRPMSCVVVVEFGACGNVYFKDSSRLT